MTIHHFATTLLLICSLNSTFSQSENQLQTLINEHPELFKEIFSQPEKFQAQVIYTQIDRDKNNVPFFTSYSVGVDENRYYYPASTVKMPTAFVALEKLNQLNINGLNKETPMFTGADRSPQTSAIIDSTAENNLRSIAHYIKKIFLVSDNDAYNRLYEWIGQQDLNARLKAKGFEDTRIWHRLSVSGFDVEDNRHGNPVSFVQNNELIYHQVPTYSKDDTELHLEDQKKGIAYTTNEGEHINKPFDFSHKNYIALQDLHDMLKAVIFPENVIEQERFDLTAEDYQFLYRAMSTFPRESEFPKYEGKEDSYVKFFVFGDTKENIPDHIRIFNKVGWAYGYLTDVSYIVDFQNNIEFMIAASISVNANQTYNDGVYEYEEIGLPYFASLGRVLYQYERERKREFTPDLKKFKVKHY